MKLSDYYVDFFYERDEDNKLTGITYCYLSDEIRLITVAVASCYYKDQFNKKLGRKAALTKALAVLAKDERATIWKDYINKGLLGKY